MQGHSNGPESLFSALLRYRRKGAGLETQAYAVTTNCGLLQGNILAATALGLEHWGLRVLKRLGLSIPPAMQEHADRELIRLAAAHSARQTVSAKKKRVAGKNRRLKQNAARKEFVPAAADSYNTDTLGAEDEDDSPFDSDAEDEDMLNLIVEDSEEEEEEDVARAQVVVGSRRRAGFGAAEQPHDDEEGEGEGDNDSSGEEGETTQTEVLANEPSATTRGGVVAAPTPAAAAAAAATTVARPPKPVSLDVFVPIAGKRVLIFFDDNEATGGSTHTDDIIGFTVWPLLLEVSADASNACIVDLTAAVVGARAGSRQRRVKCRKNKFHYAAVAHDPSSRSEFSLACIAQIKAARDGPNKETWREMLSVTHKEREREIQREIHRERCRARCGDRKILGVRKREREREREMQRNKKMREQMRR
eukprot:SAG11_NODE_1855_length_4163_cov_1.842028_3_plen_420_part_00